MEPNWNPGGYHAQLRRARHRGAHLMRAPNLAVIVVALIVGALVVLLAIGSAPRQSRRDAYRVGCAVVGNRQRLHADQQQHRIARRHRDLPARPARRSRQQRCLACHSASMALTQPPLKPEQWKATVEKMRDVYHAPIEPGDVPAIVDYLKWLDPNAVAGQVAKISQSDRTLTDQAR